MIGTPRVSCLRRRQFSQSSTQLSKPHDGRNTSGRETSNGRKPSASSWPMTHPVLTLPLRDAGRISFGVSSSFRFRTEGVSWGMHPVVTISMSPTRFTVVCSRPHGTPCGPQSIVDATSVIRLVQDEPSELAEMPGPRWSLFEWVPAQLKLLQFSQVHRASRHGRVSEAMGSAAPHGPTMTNGFRSFSR